MTADLNRRMAFFRAEIDEQVPNLHDLIVVPRTTNTFEVIALQERGVDDRHPSWASIRVTAEALEGDVSDFGATTENAIQLLQQQFDDDTVTAGRPADARVDSAVRVEAGGEPTAPVDIVGPLAAEAPEQPEQEPEGEQSPTPTSLPAHRSSGRPATRPAARPTSSPTSTDSGSGTSSSDGSTPRPTDSASTAADA